MNRRTRIWGTEYDPGTDLVRVPLALRPLTQPVERFLIAIEPQPDGGILRLVWDDREYSASMHVVQR